MKRWLALPLIAFVSISQAADDLPLVDSVEWQPFAAATERLLEALAMSGSQLPEKDVAAIKELIENGDESKAPKAIQKILDQYVAAMVTINAESRVSAVEGKAKKELIQNGWRTFLIKVQNDAGINPELKVESPNALPLVKRSSGSPNPKIEIKPTDVPHRFLDLVVLRNQPLKKNLSGLNLEYAVVQLYSRVEGKREAKLSFNVGQGTQDLAGRNEIAILFQAVPSVEVVLGVQDFDGKPTTAAFVIRDQLGRVYPNPARRLAPDFFFHDQIYRADGESVHLPPGEYIVETSRGPEYLVKKERLVVPEKVVSFRHDFKLERWIHAAPRRWFSGDHHVHAAGCAHYDNPTEGVTPADMMRHILGEDLNVGCVLSWGPCWYAQKQYFEGKTSALSRVDYLMRYDVEVSGFPSSHAGHLCLLRLTEDDYEGTTLIEEWPSWTLPVLAWGKAQNGVVGYSHSGWGLALPDYGPNGTRVKVREGKSADKLPDYAMPPFDGIGANEYIVTAAHGVCDFISAVDTPSVWELNIWYHTLNCGMKAKISGETDFPCIYGDKVGLGRIYVKLDENQPLDFDQWILGVRDGRSYCGDGLSHVLDYRINDVPVGEKGPDGQLSMVALDKPGNVKVEFDVAAYLGTEPNDAIRNRRLDEKPYWHLERSRIGQSRKVPLEIIVNGYPVEKREIEADGSLSKMTIDIPIKESSWVAVRIFPSVHTNPIWVEVGGKPVRASKRSADWCVRAVDVCWEAKKNNIRPEEIDAARKAYQEAKAIYEKIRGEAVTE